MSKKNTSKWIRVARTVVVAVAIAFIPLIYAGSLTWANQDPTHNLDQVPAAIVNLDVPATAGDATINLGADVTEELVSSTESNNFNWIEYNEQGAASALERGEVLAVLTIPSSFSEHAASPAESDPADATAATLHIETNDGANMISGSVASAIASTVRESLASEVSAEFLEQVYLGFTDIHSNISDASEGATKVADGATSAKDGSDSLVLGLTDLADGSVQLDDGAQALATGATDASAGAHTLADGLATLATSAADLPTQATALNDGAAALSSGSSQLADGITSLSDGATNLSTGVTSARDGATTLSDGLTTLAEATPIAVTGATALDQGLVDLAAGWDLLTDEQRLGAVKALELGALTLSDGLTDADTAVQELSTGASDLVGSSEQGTGLSALADGATTLSTGASTAATSAGTLRDGAATLAAGTQSLADAAPTLTDAIASASDGATSLADGVDQLSAGATDLAAGTTNLESGAEQAKTGATDLATGLGDLKTGSGELSTGLSDGVAEIPNYSESEAKQLSTVAGDPVVTEMTRANEVAGYGYGLAPYFLALALWVGGLAFYLMFPAVNKRALVTSRSAFGAAIRSYLPGAVMGIAQSILVTLVLLGPIGINAANPWGLFGMALLTSVTFIAINQALIALMGAPGRFFALVMIVLQLSAAGGTYPVQTAPSFFQTIHSWLPLTHALEAFRSLIAGGTLGISDAITTLTWWLVGALIVTVIAHAIARRGRRTPTRPGVDGGTANDSATGAYVFDSLVEGDDTDVTDPEALTQIELGHASEVSGGSASSETSEGDGSASSETSAVRTEAATPAASLAAESDAAEPDDADDADPIDPADTADAGDSAEDSEKEPVYVATVEAEIALEHDARD